MCDPQSDLMSPSCGCRQPQRPGIMNGTLDCASGLKPLTIALDRGP